MVDAAAPVEVSAPAPQASPAELNARLDRLARDKEWSARFYNNDPAARRDFDEIVAAKAGVPLSPQSASEELTAQFKEQVATKAGDTDRLDGILSGRVTHPPMFENLTGREISTRDLIAAVERMRSLNISDEAIKQAVDDDSTISKAERDAVKRLQATREADPEWRRKLAAGDPETRREFVLISIALSSRVAA